MSNYIYIYISQLLQAIVIRYINLSIYLNSIYLAFKCVNKLRPNKKYPISSIITMSTLTGFFSPLLGKFCPFLNHCCSIDSSAPGYSNVLADFED